ncbi:MAG TPA: N-acetylmuramoyl-L-alanine amidase [Mycobacteriales bacterium]|nr:N-acetylmuramoyl-L-alanine amidase [Mycobacteriales bacterium]
MRRLLSALSITAAVPVLIAVPVASRPVAGPHPVAPHLMTVALHAAGPGPEAPVRTGPKATSRFDLVGASWPAGALAAGAHLQVRVRQAGAWSGWSDLDASDAGPDRASADSRRAAVTHPDVIAAEPLWVGSADGVDARVVSDGGAATGVPTGVKVVLVDGGTSAADAHPGSAQPVGSDVAEASAGRPTIYTRSQWGADESLRLHACPSGPSYGSTITMGFIHHTDNANGYTQSQVPSIIRSIYAYHVNSNGWCDIGYNFLVDRFGRIWEGRYGGITKPVIGAHTGGFNTDTFGTSLIGNFGSTAPSSAMLSAVEKLFAWKLGSYYRDPLGKTTVTAGYFSGSRYSTGQRVTFNTISGHRDADFTTCPGSAAYSDLPTIRSAVRHDMGTGFVAPGLSKSSIRMAGGSVTVSAGAINGLTWTLKVVDPSGAVVRTLQGTANRSTPVSANWDLTDALGTAVQPGVYTLTLTGVTSGGATALPFTTRLTVTPPVTLTVPTRTSYESAVTPAGTGRPGGTVSVSVSSGGVVTDFGAQPVGSNGKWSVPASSVGPVSPVPAAHDLTWSVTDSVTGYVATRVTKVTPSIATPASTALVRSGSALSIGGTALPDNGNTVTLMTQPAGATAATAAAPVLVDPSTGGWQTSYVPTAPTTFWVRDARNLGSISRLVYPVGSASAAAPTSGYAGRSVRVTGNAGNAPAPVTLQSRIGQAKFATVATTTAATDGHFAMRLPIPDNAGSTLSWRITTGYASAVTGALSILATFPPTVTGPATAHWNSTHQLTGTAVPGDLVTVWTRPVGTTSWVQAGSTRAASNTQWAFPLTFTRDTQWQATSMSGTSPTGRTVIRPTIYAKSSVPAGTRVIVHGTAIPGSSLTLYRSAPGSSTWYAAKTVTVGADGKWSVARYPRTAVRFRATSGGHTSRTITVSTT